MLRDPRLTFLLKWLKVKWWVILSAGWVGWMLPVLDLGHISSPFSVWVVAALSSKAEMGWNVQRCVQWKWLWHPSLRTPRAEHQQCWAVVLFLFVCFFCAQGEFQRANCTSSEDHLIKLQCNCSFNRVLPFSPPLIHESGSTVFILLWHGDCGKKCACLQVIVIALSSHIFGWLLWARVCGGSSLIARLFSSTCARGSAKLPLLSRLAVPSTNFDEL